MVIYFIKHECQSACIWGEFCKRKMFWKFNFHFVSRDRLLYLLYLSPHIMKEFFIQIVQTICLNARVYYIAKLSKAMKWLKIKLALSNSSRDRQKAYYHGMPLNSVFRYSIFLNDPAYLHMYYILSTASVPAQPKMRRWISPAWRILVTVIINRGRCKIFRAPKRRVANAARGGHRQT